MAERVKVKVRSVDLQSLSVPLALSITGRISPIEDTSSLQHWIKLAREAVENSPAYESVAWASRRPSKTSVGEARRLARNLGSTDEFIMASYGGHYFSPLQAAALDQLWATRPTNQFKEFAEACIVRVASRCAAAPGHTAQPFQPTPKLIPFIGDAWSIDVFEACERQIRALAPRHGLVEGEAVVDSAENYVDSFVADSDLVFCDPPYSAAQYSRFYHVLEGIARGGYPSVGGAGRAPTRDNRPSSAFSTTGGAKAAMGRLFESLATKRSTVILTFPAGSTSLGISGADVSALAKQYFRPTQTLMAHVHSTLGGSSPNRPAAAANRSARKRTVGNRSARMMLHEMILLLEPR